MLQQESVQLPAGPAFERHFSPHEIAELWGLGVDAVRRIFMNEEGVLKYGHGETLRKRPYFTLKIPESVMHRVHRRLSQTKPGKPN